MLFTFVEACGGELAQGIIDLCGKPVRVDYVKKSLRQIAVDKPFGTSLFYKSVPINLEAWIRAMCLYDIATYVPMWWSMSLYRCRMSDLKAVTVRFGIKNTVSEADTALIEFAKTARKIGMNVERVTEETVLAVKNNTLKRDHLSPVVSLCDKKNILPFVTTLEHVTFAHIRPTQSLEYEEVIGLLERRGRVVCVGGKRNVTFMMMVETGGEIFQIRDKTSPHYLQECIDGCKKWPLWTVEMGSPTFCFGDPLKGADVRVVAFRGIRLETLIFANTAYGRRAKTPQMDEVAANVMGCIREDKKHPDSRYCHDRKITLSRQGSDVVQTICESLKRYRPEEENNRNVCQRLAPLQEWVGAPFLVEETHVPLKCRNSWVMPDGATVEKTDEVVNNTMRRRCRWPTNFHRCRMCPPLHPEPKIRETERCKSSSCKTNFWKADNLTHLYFRGERKKRVQLDKFKPLFTDDVLRELERDPRFKINARVSTIPP